MEDHLTKAQYYRDQATNMRTLAASEPNLVVRSAMISIAETYESLWLNVVVLAQRQHDQPVLDFKR